MRSLEVWKAQRHLVVATFPASSHFHDRARPRARHRAARPQQERQHYRPDQVALLTAGVHQLGMDLESLRVIELENGISKLQQ